MIGLYAYINGRTRRPHVIRTFTPTLANARPHFQVLQAWSLHPDMHPPAGIYAHERPTAVRPKTYLRDFSGMSRKACFERRLDSLPGLPYLHVMLSGSRRAPKKRVAWEASAGALVSSKGCFRALLPVVAMRCCIPTCAHIRKSCHCEAGNRHNIF